MLWKCCTHYASKFGKLSSGHRSGKGQFSFQSQRMLKLLHNCTHLTLVKKCSIFSMPGFSNTWTKNFQMFKLVLEKAEEPEIKLPTSSGSLKSKRIPEEHLFCFIDYAKCFDCMDHNKLWKILKEIVIPDHLSGLFRNLYAGQEATVRTGHDTTD